MCNKINNINYINFNNYSNLSSVSINRAYTSILNYVVADPGFPKGRAVGEGGGRQPII